MGTILVTGAGAGLGAELVGALGRAGPVPGAGKDHYDTEFPEHRVIPFDRKNGHDVRDPRGTWGECPEPLNVLINCAGVNLTGWLDEFSEASWDEVMDINVKGIFSMTKWAYEQLRRSRGTVLNIVSNASHMPMTCSAAYNASKGAAHILTLQMARELTKKDGITVFGISPNKLRGTEMSRDIEGQVVRDRGWTEAFAREYQQKSLLTGEETEPAQLAEFIAFLLSTKDRHKFLSGCILPYGA